MKTKPLALFYILFFCSLAQYSQIPNYAWSKVAGGTFSHDQATSICADQFGNVFLTGSFSGTIDIDPGLGVYMISATGTTSSCFILKLNAQGNFVWAGSFGAIGNNAVSGTSIKTDPAGNVYLGGVFSGTCDFDFSPVTQTLIASNAEETFVCKYTNAGGLLWAKQVGGGSSKTSITLDPTGSVYVCSSFTGTGDFDPGAATYTLSSFGNRDIFVGALSTSGNFIWAKQMGGSAHDTPRNIVYSGVSGDILVIGQFRSLVADFDPGPGTQTLSSFGGNDVFVCKLNNNGTFDWVGQFGGIGEDAALGVALDNIDNVYVTGGFSLTADFDPGPLQYNLTPNNVNDIYVAKLSPTGSFVFAKQFSGNSGNNSLGMDIHIDANGYIYTVGVFNTLTDFDPGLSSYTLSPYGIYDAFLSKLDASGNFVGVQQFGASGYVSGPALFVDGSGNFYVAGSLRGTADFDPGVGTSFLSSSTTTNYDVFVFKLSICIDAPINNNVYYLCEGNTATLSATSTSPVSWYASPTSSTIIGNGSTFVTPNLSTGNYTYYAAASTCTNVGIRTAVNINVVALPILTISSNPTSLCLGSSATLSASGANSYTWQNSIQGASLSVTPSLTTFYSLAGSDTISNCSNTKTYTLIVSSLPILQITTSQPTVCAGSKVILNVSGANSYTWSNASHNSSISVTPTINTSYSVSGTNSLSGCSNSQSIALTVNPCVGIDEGPEIFNINVFPNPVIEFLTIQSDQPVDIYLFNNLGAKIYEENNILNGTKIDLRYLKAGIYFVEVKSKVNSQTFKIIKIN
jgi:uncharacterized protein (DUF2249 family)